MGILYKIAHLHKKEKDAERVNEWNIENYIKFYSNEIADKNGRFLKDILKFGYFRLEGEHDYIQELFPTDEESFYNLEAPMFSKQEMRQIQDNEKVRQNIKKSYDVMIDFWKLKREGYPTWFCDGNHNCLRVTRVLKSLNLFNLYDLADELSNLLEEKIKEFEDVIPVATKYWRAAAKYRRDDL